MVSFFKSIQQVLGSILSGVPDSLRIVLDFVWKVRWFIVGGWLTLMVYSVVTKVLPFLMWGWIVKSIVGSFVPFLSL